MAEYSYDSIIIDPSKEGIESLIGKEVYYHNVPLACLGYANENCHIGTLKEIFKDAFYPFQVKTPGGHTQECTCIIPKKEEPKPEYVPFESKWEFIESYMDNRSNHEYLDHQISCSGGIWLKDKDREGAYFMVTEIWNEGVVVSDIKMKTTKEGNDEYYTTNETTEWKELLRDYTFLDGSPCGKEVEE